MEKESWTEGENKDDTISIEAKDNAQTAKLSSNRLLETWKQTQKKMLKELIVFAPVNGQG